MFRFGRLLPGNRPPGLRFIVPLADRMVKVSMQTVVLPFPVELLRFFDRATSSAVPAAEEVLATPATPTTATAAPLTAEIVVPDSPAALSQSNGDRSLTPTS